MWGGHKYDQHLLSFSRMTEPLGDTEQSEEHAERAEMIILQALSFFTKLLAVPFILKLRQPAELIPKAPELWNYSESAAACASRVHVMDTGQLFLPARLTGMRPQTALLSG